MENGRVEETLGLDPSAAGQAGLIGGGGGEQVSGLEFAGRHAGRDGEAASLRTRGAEAGGVVHRPTQWSQRCLSCSSR